jgi:hypothetical protein
MLVGGWIRRDGAVTAASFAQPGRRQADKALLQTYRRGRGLILGLILTDGCAGWLRRLGLSRVHQRLRTEQYFRESPRAITTK